MQVITELQKQRNSAQGEKDRLEQRIRAKIASFAEIHADLKDLLLQELSK